MTKEKESKEITPEELEKMTTGEIAERCRRMIVIADIDGDVLTYSKGNLRSMVTGLMGVIWE